MNETPLLNLRGVSVTFTRPDGISRVRALPGVADLDLDLPAGEILSIVGASGSGKSMLAEAVLGLLPRNATLTGEVRYRGEPLDQDRLERLRGAKISYIPQSVRNLDPLMTVGAQVRIGLDSATAGEQQQALFARYGLSPDVARQYPFQLSGGMLRRVLFATSIRDGVELVVADEPTPGLHEGAVDEILGHLQEIAAAGASVLLITHDIFAALRVSQQVAVMQQGRLVTTESAAAFHGGGEELQHPFARELWRALPQNAFAAPQKEQP
ncbi:MAG: ATP-binding cassette domain-containing protein [Microbacterium sp.]